MRVQAGTKWRPSVEHECEYKEGGMARSRGQTALTTFVVASQVMQIRKLGGISCQSSASRE